ncbi:MAG: hypothetical protein ACQSGP_22805 [Frankia sp.]
MTAAQYVAWLGIVASLPFLFWAGVKIRRNAVRRGYRSPVAVYAALYSTVAGGFMLSILALPEEGALTFWQTVMVLAVMPFVLLCCACVVNLLPMRRRPPGRRVHMLRFQRIAVTASLCGAGALVAAFVVAVEAGAWTNGADNLFGAGLTLICFGLVSAVSAGRAKGETVEDVIAADGRAPVLYLRPFERDLEFFATRNLRRPSGGFLGFDTFELFMKEAVTSRLGPMVALGNPSDYLQPAGAARTYGEDDNWQEYAGELIGKTVCVLAVVGESDSLAWEFAQILKCGRSGRLFIVASPYGPGRWKPVRLRIYNRLRGCRPISWQRSIATLNELGYRLPDERPAAGSVIGFNDTGQSITVATGARTPADYIAAITAHISHAAVRSAPGEAADKDAVSGAGGTVREPSFDVTQRGSS